MGSSKVEKWRVLTFEQWSFRLILITTCILYQSSVSVKKARPLKRLLPFRCVVRMVLKTAKRMSSPSVLNFSESSDDRKEAKWIEGLVYNYGVRMGRGIQLECQG